MGGPPTPLLGAAVFAEPSGSLFLRPYLIGAEVVFACQTAAAVSSQQACLMWSLWRCCAGAVMDDASDQTHRV